MKKETKKIVITLAVLLLLFGFSSCAAVFINDTQLGTIAVIPIHGAIYSVGSGTQGTTTADTIIPLLEKAQNNPLIKGVILDINSPGGSPVGSDEIGQAVKSLDKPVVAVIREAGASGAYWIASASDHVIANKMSVTGSIGVIGSYFGFEEFLDEYNVSYKRFVSGEKKDIGNPFREMSFSEQQFLQEKMDSIHEIFIQEVAENRNMSVEEVRELATGEFYLGFEAETKGLIDELGGYTQAEQYFIQQDIEVELVKMNPPRNFLSEILSISIETPTIDSGIII